MHLDLIAGLPFEDFNSFGTSFDDVFNLRPDVLQLGFLKLLRGTEIRSEEEKYGYRYNSKPPYEVLKNDFLSYEDVLLLKGIEEVFERYYNSGVFKGAMEFSLSKQLRKQMNWILFEEITDYMENHLTQISITGLSEEFHFQEDYFNRLIKTQTGLTYTEYLQLLRLRRAETLLLTTDATIDQITEAVGYHNKGYFYKIFTERHQLTPAQFRKKM